MSSRLVRSVVAAVALAAAACGGEPAKSPRVASDLALPLAAAFREEAVGDPAKAVDLYLRVLAAAAAAPDTPASVGVAMAATDALVHRDVNAFSDSTAASALADRVPGASVAERLAKIEAHGPFLPAIVANARLALAERRGDVTTATRERAATGCAREAVVYGPVAWMGVSGASEPSLVAQKPALPAELPSPSPFLEARRPLKVASFGCRIPLYAETSVAGVREVAVDVEVPKAGSIGVSLRSSSAARLYANGAGVLDRPHALGNRSVPRFVRLQTGAGVIRLVARVGMSTDFESIEIGAWDDDGKPLVARAPQAGKNAEAKVLRVSPLVVPAPSNDAELLGAGLGALAAGDVRAAENLLAPALVRKETAPELLLAYARAVRAARDLPVVKWQERARTAYDRVLESWPGAWEAVLEHAVLAGARRGRAEAEIEALADLDARRAKTKEIAAPALLDAFEAQAAARERLYDRAQAAFARVKGPLAGTPLLAETERVVFERTGKEQVDFACGPRAADRTSLACHRALSAAGDRAGAEKELARLRALAGTPQLYLSYSARSALETGDLGRARQILEAMNPGDRTLSTLYATKSKASPAAAAAAAIAVAERARDAPLAIPSILRDSGDDPLAAFDGAAERAIAGAAATSSIANAATAILAHRERYEVLTNGVVHFVLFDVRRVMGTTDVDANAQASVPTLFGKDVLRVLRRRIFKKDGSVVLPDRTPNAAQSHADLSQLEAGDAVEAIYEGWGLPSETGNVGIDTPDLLPERTAIREAEITLSFPQRLVPSLWSHAALGKASETMKDGRRTLTWSLKDRPVRRLESGVPKMDRSVGVSFSTATWADVARGLRETTMSLEAESPEVTSWAREAAGKAATQQQIVERVVAASGQAVKEASGTLLSDLDVGRAGSYGMTARQILATKEGSRTWLIVHALRELGVPADVVVAENEPFSDFAGYPPHFGRFMHPLAVAHVKTSEGTSDVWIDADVPGPPLPAGRASPELRGRSALWPDGRIAPLPAVASAAERDEIDIRLAIDEQGNAKGTITVLLRGHAAQDLAEALVRLVGLERQRALRGIALGWVPFATVEKVELSSTEGSWQVAMRAELTAPAYAQVEGAKPETRTWVLPGMDPVHYVFPRPFVTTLSATYAGQAERESALAINRATQYHVRRRIELPPNAQITRLPGPFEGRGPLTSASRKIAVNGASIEEDFVLDIATGTVPKERYETFVASAHQADDAFRAATRVKPPPAATPGR